MKKITFLIILSLFLTVNYTFAQVNAMHEVELFGKKKLVKSGSVIRCATTEYEEYLQSKNTNRLSTNEFERWISPKISEKKKKENLSKGFKTNAIITIPVVVHIIHNGDVVGTDENILDGQVISQIRVLNEDFRRKSGSPGDNSNPVGADVEIEFALAKRDPAGVLSDGINRVNLGQESWSLTDINTIIKPQTQWNPEKYLNIWVVKFATNDVLGYAQFPSASQLSGIDADPGAANTDGVVIGYKFFGNSTYFSSGTYRPDFDKGRTTTHEVGHWLGLRHIWGDGDCSVDDFCNDTPLSAYANYGCPSGVDSCPAPGLDMVQNYMDYTYDLCMNVFTNDQKTRMVTVMANSSRRTSLKTSDALTPGTVYTIDASVSVVNLKLNSCSNAFAPIINLVNKGSATITEATITYGIDNANMTTYNWAGSLANNQSQEITLNSLSTIGGNHNFSVSIVTVNTTTDQNVNNNSTTVNFDISKSYSDNSVTLVLQLDEYGSETTWQLTNSAGTKVYQGGPYTDTPSIPTSLTIPFSLTNNDCYTFTIFDSEEDGICCTNGSGYYKLKTSTNETIVLGGTFDNEKSTSFIIGTLATADIKSSSSVYIYPNPTSDILNIIAENKLETPDSYTIINSLGQIIKSKKIKTEDDLHVNVSSLSQGMYFLKLSKNQSETTTIQFIKK